MPVFFALLIKVIPLYGNLALGFVAGKWLHVQRDSIASLMIYIIAPIVFFGGITKMQLTPALLFMPALGWLLSLIIGGATYLIARRLYSDGRPNIMAAAAGTGNNGYFGLPIAMMLFDAQTVGIYLMLVIGVTIYESTIGFYMTAKGQYSASDSLRKTLRLPVIYALFGGAAISLSGLSMPAIFYDFLQYFEGTYTVLGMMIIGLGLSGMRNFSIDVGFTAILFVARFIAWPLLALGVVWLDQQIFDFYSDSVRRAVLLISIMPLAANSVAIAALLKCEPEKTATAVVLSTIFAALYVPVMVALIL
ncbi:MAG: AEC family transporter [Alphaproteobacteria bacterium]|nr:AEC family transporter [Alphaproteobacteria bacterium]